MWYLLGSLVVVIFFAIAFTVVALDRLWLIKYLNLDTIQVLSLRQEEKKQALESFNTLITKKFIEKNLLMLYRLRGLIEKGRTLQLIPEETAIEALSIVRENLEKTSCEIGWGVYTELNFTCKNQEELDFQKMLREFQDEFKKHEKADWIIKKVTSSRRIEKQSQQAEN